VQAVFIDKRHAFGWRNRFSAAIKLFVWNTALLRLRHVCPSDSRLSLRETNSFRVAESSVIPIESKDSNEGNHHETSYPSRL
jgi:hypothetical protein